MSSAVLQQTLDFMRRISDEAEGDGKIKVTFHGGEPLLAGIAFWREALDGLQARFGSSGTKLAVQSNLWFLDEDFCQMFRQHRVEIGTSLDGPQDITDAQRGDGYFAQTMRSIALAQSRGLRVGCIATFTSANLPRWREVFDFFLSERLDFSIHHAVPTLDGGGAQYALSPDRYASLLAEMLDYYIAHRRDLAVSSLDQLCQATVSGDGKICTFRDCLGMFLAIDPVGNIFPCQRFCGRPEWRVGTLADKPTLAQLYASPIAQKFREREEKAAAACGDCGHTNYCKGGCPYNAWAGGTHERILDPYCEAYNGVFGIIRQKLSEEIRSPENIEAIAELPYEGGAHPLLRKGPLTEIARGGPHPSVVARTAKRIVAAVELARGPDHTSVGKRLLAMGICRTTESAAASLAALDASLHPSKTTLNNLYLHVTFRCQLRCTHCYAGAGPEPTGDMPVDSIESLIRQAKDEGFRQVVVTGGEPLIHGERRILLERLAALRPFVAPMNLVLRTNFTLQLTDDDMRLIGRAFDQVVASVDGSRETHDARRGKGSYDKLVCNLERYQALGACGSELSLAAVMRAEDIQGDAGNAVRELAQRLQVRRTRFRPLLPLGRAKDWPEPPQSEALSAHITPLGLIENGFHPVASCGLGQNLYIEPSGETFPCYAYHRPHSLLGNVVELGLKAVLERPGFCDLSCHTVDSNAKCRKCEVRYLCGGACRAWGGEHAQHNLDSVPTNCTGLRTRALALYREAKTCLGL